jgi:uncharacterized delta-60 repeat protein
MFTFLLASVAFVFGAGAQQPGTMDNSFGTNGVILPAIIPMKGEFAMDMVVLSDDSFVIVGVTESPNQDVVVVKFNADGSADANFGTEGKLILDLSIGGDDMGLTIAEQPDGKLLIGGTLQVIGGNDGFVMRLMANGEQDFTFGDGTGIVYLNAGTGIECLVFDLLVGEGGEIFALAAVSNGANSIDVGLFKMNHLGALDLSFASSGVSLIGISAGSMEVPMSLDRLPNGRFVISGFTMGLGAEHGFVMMLNSFGLIENMFNGTGYYLYSSNNTENRFNAVKAVGDKIVAAGRTRSGDNSDGVTVRLNQDGTLDSSYGSNGMVISDIGNSNGVYLFGIQVLEDDRLLFTGSVYGQSMNGPYALMLDANGSAVSEFAPTGSIYPSLGTNIASIEGRISGIQSEERILLGGHLTGASYPKVNVYVTRIFGLDNTVSVQNFSSSESTFSLYPNPATDYFRLQFSPGETLERAELYDLSGRIIASWPRGTAVFTLPGNAAPGLHLLRVTTDERMLDTRLMIAR